MSERTFSPMDTYMDIVDPLDRKAYLLRVARRA
jgi:hypothetical protein